MSNIKEQHVLCYVSGGAAYFTNQPLDKQWGDDWDDVPYEHNAGRPYGWQDTKWDHKKRGFVPNDEPPWVITEVHWSGPFVTPNEHHNNSPYSVENINSGRVAWLQSPNWGSHGVNIYAGTTLEDFIRLVKSVGGRIWTELKEATNE